MKWSEETRKSTVVGELEVRRPLWRPSPSSGDINVKINLKSVMWTRLAWLRKDPFVGFC